MKKVTVTIGQQEYMLNYNVNAENKCEVVSLLNADGSDQQNQVAQSELQSTVDWINADLAKEAASTEAAAGETTEDE